MIRRPLPLAVLAAAVALGLAACGSDDGGSTTAAQPPPPAPTSTTPPPPMPPPPPPTETTPTETTPTETTPKPRTVTVVVRNGEVVGGLVRARVEQGDRVVLVVRSDVADEVHLHGYDQQVDVLPNTPARLAFTASLPGRFEVELEQRGLAIADIEVRP